MTFMLIKTVNMFLWVNVIIRFLFGSPKKSMMQSVPITGIISLGN